MPRVIFGTKITSAVTSYFCEFTPLPNEGLQDPRLQDTVTAPIGLFFDSVCVHRFVGEPPCHGSLPQPTPPSNLRPTHSSPAQRSPPQHPKLRKSSRFLVLDLALMLLSQSHRTRHAPSRLNPRLVFHTAAAAETPEPTQPPCMGRGLTRRVPPAVHR